MQPVQLNQAVQNTKQGSASTSAKKAPTDGAFSLVDASVNGKADTPEPSHGIKNSKAGEEKQAADRILDDEGNIKASESAQQMGFVVPMQNIVTPEPVTEAGQQQDAQILDAVIAKDNPVLDIPGANMTANLSDMPAINADDAKAAPQITIPEDNAIPLEEKTDVEVPISSKGGQISQPVQQQDLPGQVPQAQPIAQEPEASQPQAVIQTNVVAAETNNVKQDAQKTGDKTGDKKADMTNADGKAVPMASVEDEINFIQKIESKITELVDASSTDDAEPLDIKSFSDTLTDDTEQPKLNVKSDHSPHLQQVQNQSQAAQAVQSAPKAENATPIQRPIFEQLVDRITVAAQNGTHEMEMQLDPVHLGKLSIQLIMTQEGVSAQIKAPNPAIQGLLNSQLAELESNLKAQGINVINMDIIQDRSAGMQQDSPERHSAHENHKGAKHSFAALPVDNIAAVNDMTAFMYADQFTQGNSIDYHA